MCSNTNRGLVWAWASQATRLDKWPLKPLNSLNSSAQRATHFGMGHVVGETECFATFFLNLHPCNRHSTSTTTLSNYKYNHVWHRTSSWPNRQGHVQVHQCQGSLAIDSMECTWHSYTSWGLGISTTLGQTLLKLAWIKSDIWTQSSSSGHLSVSPQGHLYALGLPCASCDRISCGRLVSKVQDEKGDTQSMHSKDLMSGSMTTCMVMLVQTAAGVPIPPLCRHHLYCLHHNLSMVGVLCVMAPLTIVSWTIYSGSDECMPEVWDKDGLTPSLP